MSDIFINSFKYNFYIDIVWKKERNEITRTGMFKKWPVISAKIFNYTRLYFAQELENK